MGGKRSYNPSDFEPYLLEADGPHHGPSTSEIPNDIPLLHVDNLNLPAWLKYLILTGNDPDISRQHQDRSTPEWSALRGLVRFGFDDVTIAGVMLNPAHRISEKPREKGRKWFEAELGRARSKPWPAVRRRRDATLG